jgi:hypothetical protein
VCPHCGAKIINGVPQGPNIGQNPRPNPVNPNPVGPINPNPNPNPVVVPGPDANPKPAEQPKVEPKPEDPIKVQPVLPVSTSSPSSSPNESGSGPGVLPFVIGGIALGAVMLGVAVFLVLRNMSQAPQNDYVDDAPRSRRVRRPVRY